MIVCNASPLIALANLDRLDLLDRLFHEWCVPARVATACTVDQKPFAATLRAALPGHVLTVSAAEPVRSLRLLVDHGEAEVIALAEEKSIPQVLNSCVPRTLRCCPSDACLAGKDRVVFLP